MQGTLPAACAALACVAAVCISSRKSTVSADPENQAATVAYVPNAKKKAFFAALCSTLTKRGIRTQALTPDSSLAGTEDPPLLIVHKLTDDIALAADSAEAAARLAAVHAVTASNPSIIMLDPISAIENVRDRRKMAAIVQKLLPAMLPLPHAEPKVDVSGEPLAAVTVRMPRTVEVLAADKAEAPPEFSYDRMLVVKSAAACSTPESHYMAVVESWEQIASLDVVAKDHSVCPTFPVVVQPYIPHGGIVYKVYVVGSAPVRVGHQQDAARYYVVPKPSLRLTPHVKSSVPACPEPSNGNNQLLLFDALHPSRTPAGSALFQQVQADDVDVADHTSSTEHLQAPPDWVIEALNKELQRVLGLTLFGYDLVCEESTGEYWILDINYFPSYKGCEGVVDAVADTIEGCLLASSERGDATPHEQRKLVRARTDFRRKGPAAY